MGQAQAQAAIQSTVPIMPPIETRGPGRRKGVHTETAGCGVGQSDSKENWSRLAGAGARVYEKDRKPRAGEVEW